MPPSIISTYSITAFDPASQSWGVTVQSRYFGVGRIVPWAEAGLGALATQAMGNPGHWNIARPLLKAGETAADVLEALLTEDDFPEQRQISIVDAKGCVAVHTGKNCLPNAGHRAGDGFSVQGNCLAHNVLSAMESEFRENENSGVDFPGRLMETLKAAQFAGGDHRGMQAAGLLVVSSGKGHAGGNDRSIDLRVDDHTAPLEKLEALLEYHRVLYGLDRSKWLQDADELSDELIPLLHRYGYPVRTGKYQTELSELLSSYNLSEAFDPETERLDRRAIEALSKRLDV